MAAPACELRWSTPLPVPSGRRFDGAPAEDTEESSILALQSAAPRSENRVALGFNVNITSPLGIGARGFDPREGTDTGGNTQEMTVVPVRTVAQGIGLMLGSKLGEGCNESRVIIGGQDQVESRRQAIHRKAKSRGMVPDTSGNNRFGLDSIVNPAPKLGTPNPGFESGCGGHVYLRGFSMFCSIAYS